MLSASRTMWLVVPCFHDFPSFLELRKRLSLLGERHFPDFRIEFVLIDDSAGRDQEISSFSGRRDFRVLMPPFNLGHQGALVYALRSLSPLVARDDLVVTMDCDGEDTPESLPELIRPLLDHPDDKFGVAVARRAGRKESILFKVMYFLFRMLFRLMTGTVICSGNFVAYRGWTLHSIISHPYFDYCYSSSFVSLKLVRYYVPIARGSRYFGMSRMGFSNLVSHGFRMMLPFSEVIAVRTICASSILIMASLVISAGGFLLMLSHTPLSGPFFLVSSCLFLAGLVAAGIPGASCSPS